jgi:hypothetical protein
MTTDNNNMGRFFDLLVKPMNDEDIKAWYLANNITPELTELFRDFCISFLNLLKNTYLGDDFSDNKETKIGMTNDQKKEHFNWCWKKTIDNFNKESIDFVFSDIDAEFFENFFFEVFYNQPDQKVKDTIDNFFTQIFDIKKTKTKSDIEILTDIYKTLERSLKII